jgi:hypothetical protein
MPVAVSAEDVAHASRVIAIGVPPAAASPGGAVAVETWSDVPAASVNYSAARASLAQHVDALLNELQQERLQ